MSRFPLSLTVKALFKARLWRVMVLCAILALGLTAGLVAVFTISAASLVHVQTGWLDTLVNWLAGLLFGIGGWFMLPALTVLIASLFQDRVIEQVERIYYPDSRQRSESGFWVDFRHDLIFTLKALVLNALVLPLHLLGIGFAVAVVLNSYLLGREFFEAAAGFHLGKPLARTLGRRHRSAVYGGGLAITLATLVPGLNIFVPVIATVWMVHVYHFVQSLEAK